MDNTNLQNGASAQGTESLAEQVLAALKQGANPNEILSTLEELVKSGQVSEDELAEAAQVLQEYSASSMKCGGKVRSKVKKCACGKKMQMGAEIKKAKKGCACELKRVGGKLIEVNSCTGLPVHRNGGTIRSFQTGGQPGYIYVKQGSSYVDPTYEHNKDSRASEFDFYMDRDGRNGLYARSKSDPSKIYFSKNHFFDILGGGDQFDSWEELSGDKLAAAAGYFDPTKDNYVSTDSKSGKMHVQKTGTYQPGTNTAQAQAAQAAQAAQTTRTSGSGISNSEALARQQEMLNAQGFNAQLRGRNNGADGIWGSSSQSEWERYQQWKNSGNNLTNQQLLNYDPNAEGAISLGADAEARRQRLLAAQNARNEALTFNGTQYADEAAYNAAVGTANQNAANDYYQAQSDYNTNRALSTGYAGITRGIQNRRNAAFDNLAALNAGTLDFNNLSGRDIRDMRRQMNRGKRQGLYTAETAKDFYKQPGAMPELIGNYAGPSAFTQEQLNSTTYAKNGAMLMKKGNKIYQVPKAQWGVRNGIRAVGDLAGTVAGGATAVGDYFLTGDDWNTAKRKGSEVNATVDNWAQNQGSAAGEFVRNVPVVGRLNRAVDDFMSEKVGNYDANTGNIVTSDGTARKFITPMTHRQRGMQQQQLAQNSNNQNTFYNWLNENAPEYTDVDSRARLASQYGMDGANYTGTQEQNMELWERMKRDQQNGYEFGGPKPEAITGQVQGIQTAQGPSASSIQISGPSVPQVDANREAAIAAMSGRRVSNRERERYGAAYDAIQNGANPNELSSRQMADIQRMGKTYGSQYRANQSDVQAARNGGYINLAKNGAKVSYSDYLNGNSKKKV